jgi:hypothetical protein
MPGVSDLAGPLPDNVEALRTLLRSALSERDAAIAERDAAIVERDRALEQNEQFRHLLHQLRRAHFGRSSEKLDPDQLQFGRWRASRPRRSGAPKPAQRSAAAAPGRATRAGQAESKPLVDALKTWRAAELDRVSGNSVIAAAFHYGLNQSDGLVRHVEDGRMKPGLHRLTHRNLRTQHCPLPSAAVAAA